MWSLSKNKTKRLEEALKQAEELHKSVNMLLEWLSDAEMKLRFSGPLPEDEEEVRKQIEVCNLTRLMVKHNVYVSLT